MHRIPKISIVLLLLLGLTAELGASGGEPAYARVPLDRIAEFRLALESGDEADVYFPSVGQARRFPVVAFLQGALVDKEFYSEFARQVAQHGFILVVPNHFRELIPGQGPQLFTELQVILDVQAQAALEDRDPASPLFGRVDTTRLGLAGHSFGGAAALFAIEETCSPPFCEGGFERPAELGAAALFGANSAAGPIILDIDSSAVPTALVQGLRDGAAEPEDGLATFDLLEPPRAIIGLSGVNHFGITDVNNPPGAEPDPIDPEITQPVAIRRVAGWTGVFLRAYLYDDPLALELVFESGGLPAGEVRIRADDGAAH